MSYELNWYNTFSLSWSSLVVHRSGQALEIELFDGEAIIQISGKYAHYLQTLMLTTNRGYALLAGQPSDTSLNTYLAYREAELCFICNRVHGAIASTGAHWAVVDPAANGTAEH